jgi:hypothetical protein
MSENSNAYADDIPRSRHALTSVPSISILLRQYRWAREGDPPPAQRKAG